MTNTHTPRLIFLTGGSAAGRAYSHWTTDTGEQPGPVLTLCGDSGTPMGGAAPAGDASCGECARIMPTLGNPYMGYSRDELAEAVEQIAAAIAASPQLRPEDRLHAITEAELELAETRRRIVVTLFRTGPGRAGWGAGYWSWERIGNILGISRQGARKTYGPLVERAALADRVAAGQE